MKMHRHYIPLVLSQSKDERSWFDRLTTNGFLFPVGFYTLEGFALMVDPMNQRLAPVPRLYMLVA